MRAAKCQIEGSDYIGAFLAATERYTFCPRGLPKRTRGIIEDTLGTTLVETFIGGCSLVGMLCRANRNGIAISNLAYDDEVKLIRKACPDINVEVLDSGINAIGNNMLANDSVCLVDPDYSQKDMDNLEQILGIKVFAAEAGGYKTVGANNIMTVGGMAINNRATDAEKAAIDKITGFKSVRTTANTGSLSIGISAVANSKGIIAGYGTTGFEMNRLLEALER